MMKAHRYGAKKKSKLDVHQPWREHLQCAFQYLALFNVGANRHLFSHQ